MAGFRGKIEPAGPGDVAAILALERETASAPHWSQEAYRAALSDGEGGRRRCVMIARLAGEVAGFAVGSLVADVAELESVVVRPMERRQGLGRALCSAVVTWAWEHGASAVELEVRAGGVGARALYTGQGFVECGRRPDYYSEPLEDGVLMRVQRTSDGSGQIR